MSEETDKDVNKNPSSESSTEQVLGIGDASKSEADPKSAQNTEPSVVEDKTVPMSRFKEVIDQKNDLSRRLESLESRYDEREERNKPNPVDEFEKSLISKGMEESNAKALAASQYELTNKLIDEKVAPIQKSTVQAEIDASIQAFAAKHEDYYDLEPEMYEVYKTLDPQTQNLVASSKGGLQLLYGHVKSNKLQSDLDEAYKTGVEKGYKTKRAKTAMTSEPGASSTNTGLPTAKQISEMSLEEYRKSRDKILRSQSKISLE